MTSVKIISGIYGYRAEPDGAVEPKGVGDVCSVTGDEAQRLVALGVAEMVGVSDDQQSGDDEKLDETKLKRLNKVALLNFANSLGIDDLSEESTKADIIAAIMATSTGATIGKGDDQQSGDDGIPPSGDAAQDAVV